MNNAQRGDCNLFLVFVELSNLFVKRENYENKKNIPYNRRDCTDFFKCACRTN